MIAGRAAGLSNQIETIEAMAVGFYLEHQAAIEDGANDWHRLKMQICEDTGYRCVQCHHSKNLEIHHIIPRGYHGPERPLYDIDHPDNLSVLCRECHERIQPVWRDHVLPLRMKMHKAREAVRKHGYWER